MSSGKIFLKEIAEKIIGSCIEVRGHLGAGLLESIYEEALSYVSTQRFSEGEELTPVRKRGFLTGVKILLTP